MGSSDHTRLRHCVVINTSKQEVFPFTKCATQSSIMDLTRLQRLFNDRVLVTKIPGLLMPNYSVSYILAPSYHAYYNLCYGATIEILIKLYDIYYNYCNHLTTLIGLNKK